MDSSGSIYLTLPRFKEKNIPAVDNAVKTISALCVLASTMSTESAPMAARPPCTVMIRATMDMLTACRTFS